MLITTQNEIISLMPTARWDRPEQLFGYLDEEESVALEPLLGSMLYEHVCTEYRRLQDTYVDITSTTIRRIGEAGKAKADPGVTYAHVTERLDAIQSQSAAYIAPCAPLDDAEDDVPTEDMMLIRLIRICQQIEFYKMLAHKSGLLTVSFNEGGGMNVISAEGYDPADDKRMERVVKDAFMSAGRAVDSLLLFLEEDAKGEKQFTELWKEANAFYLHKDLLFQTARALNEYLDIRGERMVYVSLVRDVRFCQNTYLKPRIGGKLLKAVVDWVNNANEQVPDESREVYDELAGMLRQALAFYVEARREEVNGKKLARNDSMIDAQQALAMAAEYVAEHLSELGVAAEGTPIYKQVKDAEAQATAEMERAKNADGRHRCHNGRHRDGVMFTGFPMASAWRTEKK